MRKLSSPPRDDMLLDLSLFQFFFSSTVVLWLLLRHECMCVTFPLLHVHSVPLLLPQICCQKWRRGLFWWEKQAEMEHWSKHCRYSIPLLTLTVHWGSLVPIKVADVTGFLDLISRTWSLCFEGHADASGLKQSIDENLSFCSL